MGLAACCLLSLMMQQLVTRTARPKPDWAAGFEREFGAHVAGPAVVVEERCGQGTRLLVDVPVRAGADRRDLAPALGAEVWRRVLAARAAVAEVVIRLRLCDGSVEQHVAAAPPR